MFHHLLSALEKTSLLLSICHPASLYPTDRPSDLLHLSALAPTPLPSISHPASLTQTDTGQDHVHLGALARTPLFQYNSQPASLVLTGTDLLHRLVLTLLPPDILLLARSSPTDLSLLWPPTPARLPCIDRDRTVLLVQALLLVVITRTGHLLICTQRRENFQRTRTVLLPNPTKLLVRNRHIERS